MATIGSFTANKDGYTGTIRTMTINVKAKIVINENKKSDSAPDYRIYAGQAELGAAWKAQSKGDEPRDYLSILLDDPSFAEPIRAALFPEEETAYLVWNRRDP
ncbi:MAG: DUF736 domain-containing protein [Rhizobiaceae bacterium]|nr:DUF736 domain-containing protein [Rhizobiaceae bacterium]MBL4696427.1 DUF736 domain-containing protein [Rhizobiaceae bacterium]